MYWDAGLGNVPSIVLVANKNDTLTAQTYSTLVAGATYNFAIRANNSLGYGPFSTSTPFIASTVPLQTPTPTVLTASST